MELNNKHNTFINAKDAPRAADGEYLHLKSPHSGRPVGSTNLHSKHPSSIATRLKAAGVDWVRDLAAAIQENNETRINMWMRMLPYLVVTAGHRKARRGKGKASRAALAALDELESR